MALRMILGWAVAAALAAGVVPAQAQTQPVTTIDPNTAIDSDLGRPQQVPPPAQQTTQPTAPDDTVPPPDQGAEAATPADQPRDMLAVRREATNTFQKDDLIGAAEGLFGKGAADFARVIENILRDQGEPNAYIAGREASGAFVFGVRYGSGKLFHKIEGERDVYWTGPSVGFDVGGDAAKVFVLVYNLYDTQDIYKRFAQGEGRAYFIGGMSVSYLRRGKIVLIPVRLGVGVRLGANAGYMKFTEKHRWLPF